MFCVRLTLLNFWNGWKHTKNVQTKDFPVPEASPFKSLNAHNLIRAIIKKWKLMSHYYMILTAFILQFVHKGNSLLKTWAFTASGSQQPLMSRWELSQGDTLTCEYSFSRAWIETTARKHTKSFCCVFNNGEKHLPLQEVLIGGLSQFWV